MRLLQDWKKRPQELLLLTAGAVVLLLLCVYIFTGGLVMFHSDTAAPIRLAMEMIRTGELFPEDWIGSTGPFSLLLIGPIWLFLILTGDAMLAKMLASVVMVLMLLATILFSCRRVFGGNSWVLALPILFTCYSTSTHYDMLFLQAAYVVPVVLMLVSVACFCWAVQDLKTLAFDRRRLLVAATVLLLNGTLGIMALQSTLLPLLGALVIRYLMQHGKTTSLKRLPHGGNLLALLVAAVMAGMCGFAISTILSSLSGVVGNAEMMALGGSIETVWGNLGKIVGGIVAYVGYATGAPLFSLQGILSIVSFVLFVTFVVILPIMAYRDFRNASGKVQFFMVFTLLHLLEILLILLFCGVVDHWAAGRYMITSFVLLMLVGVNYAYNRYIAGRDLLSWFWTACVALAAVLLMVPLLGGIRSGGELRASMDGLTDYLVKNGLNHGYATFWNAGKNTVLANGEVEINGIHVAPGGVTRDDWLTSKEWYRNSYHQGETFLMLTDSEQAIYSPAGDFSDTLLGAPQRVLEYGEYNILVYDYNIAKGSFGAYSYDGSENWLGKMYCTDPVMWQEDGSVQLTEWEILYGPYITLPDGNYRLEIQGENLEKVSLRITANDGKQHVSSARLQGDRAVVELALSQELERAEFTMMVDAGQTATIRDVRLTALD